MSRILVVEDDPDIQEMLSAYLRNAGYEQMVAGDGLEAVAEFHRTKYDLVLLDLMLPKIDGFSVCELIRRESQIPIIMLTALDSEEKQLQGFALRIDDYVTKPFSMPVLLQKIAAVLRRYGNEEAPSRLLRYKELTLDLESYQVRLGDSLLDLTLREFELLETLLRNQGRVLTREILLSHVWSYEFLGDERIVDTHIKNIRKKVQRDYIETVRGIGYRVEKE